MGLISGLVDFIIVLFSAIMVVTIPLIDAQTCLPDWLYHPSLVDLKQWYCDEFGDYVLAEKPLFFTGIAWLEIFFFWPLAVANVYGILGRKSWVGKTELMLGVSSSTCMAVISAELMGSGRAQDKLLLVYAPFAAFSVLAALRGLFPQRRCTSTSSSHAPSARKKRA